MATTITVSERTRKRLEAYKRGGSTFDQVLNRLMDEVDLADVMAEHIAEHHRVLNDPKTVWVDGDDVIAQLKGTRKAPARVVRVGPRSGHVQAGHAKEGGEADPEGPTRGKGKARRRARSAQG